MSKVKNKNKYPVCFTNGCHCSEFKVSFTDFLYKEFTNVPTPECFSWCLTRKKDGGAIATVGNTGFGWGGPGLDDLKYLDGWFDIRFFYQYGTNKTNIVGQMLGNTLKDNINEFFDHGGSRIDRSIVEEKVLFGDPSLRIAV